MSSFFLPKQRLNPQCTVGHMFIVLTTTYRLGQYADGHKRVPRDAGGAQHDVTQAAPDELKLGKGGWVSW